MALILEIVKPELMMARFVKPRLMRAEMVRLEIAFLEILFLTPKRVSALWLWQAFSFPASLWGLQHLFDPGPALPILELAAALEAEVLR